MKTSGNFRLAVRSLFHNFTGIGKKPEGLAPESEALAAVFLPLAGFAAGLAAAGTAALAGKCGLIAASAVAGLAVLTVFGGFRQIAAAASLFSERNRAAGAAATAVLTMLFEAFAIYEAAAYNVNTLIFPALLYLPVAWAVGMAAAASAVKAEDAPGAPFAEAKGWNMLLACALAFALMAPEFGLLSLIFVASSVLAGAVAALAMGKKRGGEAAYVGALASGLLYCLLFMLTSRPIVFY